jgi:hypothetical protein
MLEFGPMNMLRLTSIAILAGVSLSTAQAGPCTVQIERVQAQLDKRIEAIAGAGATGGQSVAAQLGHQPTPGSIAAAEEKLGEGKSLSPALAALSRARKADADGDSAGCDQALAEAERALAP